MAVDNIWLFLFKNSVKRPGKPWFKTRTYFEISVDQFSADCGYIKSLIPSVSSLKVYR